MTRLIPGPNLMAAMIHGASAEAITNEAVLRVYRENIRKDKNLPWALRAKLVTHIDQLSPEERQELGGRILAKLQTEG